MIDLLMLTKQHMTFLRHLGLSHGISSRERKFFVQFYTLVTYTEYRSYFENMQCLIFC